MADVIMFMLIIVTCVAAAYFISKNNRPREMTALERTAYETRRGQMIAEEEYKNRRRYW